MNEESCPPPPCETQARVIKSALTPSSRTASPTYYQFQHGIKQPISQHRAKILLQKGHQESKMGSGDIMVLPFQRLCGGMHHSEEENKTNASRGKDLLDRKLKDTKAKLSMEDSIDLLMHCIDLGKEQAKKAEGKDMFIFLGNTGAGKSTTINYLAGCEMESVSFKDPRVKVKGLKLLKSVVLVKEQENTTKEVMKIGHSKKFMTFTPEIAIIGKQTYCDCPGFFDNRGPEINIANAVNIRTAINSAQNARAMILIKSRVGC